jgi:hypothetical protein
MNDRKWQPDPAAKRTDARREDRRASARQEWEPGRGTTRARMGWSGEAYAISMMAYMPIAACGIIVSGSGIQQVAA